MIVACIVSRNVTCVTLIQITVVESRRLRLSPAKGGQL